MLKEILCTECMDFVNAKRVEEREVFKIKDETIEVDSFVYECPMCSEHMYDPKNPSFAINEAYNIYRYRKNILNAEEIKATREKYGFSQRQLAKMLGWGHASISRYESGALPSTNHNNTLVLLGSPENTLELLDRNRENFSSSEYRKLHDKVVKTIEKNKNNIMLDFADHIFSSKPSEYTGYNTFNIDKLTNMIKFFTDKVDNLFKMKLLKFLFYADFLSFKRSTISISGLQYKRLPMGPVPDDYDLLLDLVVKTGEIDKEIVSMGYPNPGEKFTASGEVDFSVFNKDEIRVLEDICELLSRYNSQKISDLSHEEDAWLKTDHVDIISYKHGSTLSLG